MTETMILARNMQYLPDPGHDHETNIELATIMAVTLETSRDHRRHARNWP
jgi:hypothetical protein